MYVILTGLYLACMPIIKTNAAFDPKSAIMGQWEVTVPDAFPGFQNYALHIRELSKTIVIDIQGSELDIKEMKFVEKNGKLWANIYINGELEKVVIWEEKGEIKAVTVSDVGELPWFFKKVVRKE